MTCQRCADLERALAGVRELADEMECTYGDNCPDFGSRHGRCIGCKLHRALAAADKMGPEAAGNCSKCGGPVYHRPGKPGEYDHECAADDKMGPGEATCGPGTAKPTVPVDVQPPTPMSDERECVCDFARPQTEFHCAVHGTMSMRGRWASISRTNDERTRP